MSLLAAAASLKLKAEVGDPLLYGLVFSTATAALGAAARPLAGRASDALGHTRLLALSTGLYIPLAYGVVVAHGAWLVLVWLVPLYPFRDVAQSMSVSVSLPRALQATAAGVIEFSTSLGGLLVLALYPLLAGGGLGVFFAYSTALLASSLALLAPLLAGGASPRA